MRRYLILVSLVGMLAGLTACDGNFCLIGCDGGQQTTQTGPTAVPSPGASPSASPLAGPSPFEAPSPAELPPCVPQTLPFVCLPGYPTLAPILLAAQSKVPWQPEAVYVAALVRELNKDPRVCAMSGFPLPSDEISIKYRTNSSSENFDVVNADGTIQAIPAGPATPNGPANQCTPARF